MNIIQKIFGLKSQSRKIKKSDKDNSDNKGVPISQSSEFITHTETTSKVFNYLITDFGFNLTKNEFVSREHLTVYSKSPIEIEIMFEIGSLPFVSIKNNNLPYDESKGLDNSDNIEHFNVLKQTK